MRKKLPARVEKEILHNSARRCCICYGLHRDFAVKSGQIAHVDRDSKNNSVENLMFLCLDHHSEYDSRSKQSKGFTSQEVIGYRDNLYEKVHRDLKGEEIYKEESDLESKKADQVVSIIERYQSIDSKSSVIIRDEVLSRFHKICECINRVSEIHNKLIEKDISEEELARQCDMNERHFIDAFGIPRNTWGVSGSIELDSEWVNWVEDKIATWTEGKCYYSDCSELLWALDEEHDLDYTYILYGIPLSELDRISNTALMCFIYEFGLRASDPSDKQPGIIFDSTEPIKF